MWTIFVRGTDSYGEDDYYALVGIFDSYEEARNALHDEYLHLEKYLDEKYGQVQYDEIELTPLQIRTNLCETIYEMKEEVK